MQFHIDIKKRDSINFPTKVNVYKIYPLTKEFAYSISKNNTNALKEEVK